MKLDVHYGHRKVGRRVAAKSCLVRIRKWLDGSRKKSRNALSLSTNKKKAQATAGSNASILGSPPNSGRKVQAQRKFAQGAIVPHSNNVPDRRRDVTPREDQGHRLGQNTMVKMHAKNLLDVVAFKNMHSHLQPFVLLKRLPESSVENGNQSTEKERGPETSNSATMTPGLYKRLARTKQLANMKTKQMHTMKLRSRQVQQPKNVIKNNKRKLEPPPTTRAKRRRVMQPSISEYSVDDYKPLTYFTTRQTPPVTRSKPRPLPGRAGATVKTKVKDNSKSKTPAPVPSTVTSCDMSHSEELLANISLAMDRRVICHADLFNFSSGMPSDLNEKLIANGLKPIDRAQASRLFVKLDGPYYSSSQIARWVDTCTQTAAPSGDSSSEIFKTPLPPPPMTRQIREPSLDIITKCEEDTLSTVSHFTVSSSLTPCPKSPVPIPAINDCPSNKYMTVTDVLRASQAEKESRCNECTGCNRVEKVHKIEALVTSPLGGKIDLIEDIYEFKPSDDLDSSEVHLGRYRGRRSNREGDAKSCLPSTSTSSDEHYNLNILPENSTHIIQIICVKDSKTILRASFVPKSLANSAKELLLIEDENLLDQLVTNLTATKHNEKMVTTDGDVMIADQNTETEPVTLEAPVTQADLEPNTNSNRRKPTPRAVRLEQRKIPKGSSGGPGPSVSKNTPIDHTDAQSNLVVMSDVSMPSTNGTTMPRLHETDNYRPESVISIATDTQAGEGTSIQEDCATDLDAQSSRASTSNRSFANCRIENVVSFQSEAIPDTPEPPKERETRSSEATKTNNKASFPKSLESAKCVDAPVFYPTEEEFQDPIAYFDKIMPAAAKFGLCKIVAPAGFKPTCVSNDNIRFNVMNQYVARMYSRWGPAQREMSAIKAYLASQSVRFIRAPLLDCMEVDLPKLYHMVQHNGGLKKVIEKKRWARVASEMRNSRNLSPGKKLDYIYVKYILPYGTLSHAERQDMMRKVDHCWYKKNQKMLDRALNPLHRQKKMLGESDSSADEEEDDDEEVNFALLESEDCVVLGRNMNLAMFKRTAANVKMVQFPRTPKPKAGDIESKYWKTVLLGTDHVCVNSASIDTGNEGYGFTKNKNDPYGKHPWNLKMVSQNPGNVLRSLGPVMGVTSPTLHLGMLYSTSCWHRDPHGLPWVEYMHTGPRKIWYGIPGEQSENFRSAVEKLCPTSCQNKSIWLPSDITMIPPNLLCEHNVSLSRVTQEPGTFIIVFPKAYSCSIATGYTQSESVYFATSSWLDSVHHIFQELRQSCEPTMFSLEQLLMSVAKDSRVSLTILQKVHSHLSPIVNEELANRRTLAERGVKFTNTESRNRKPNTCRRPRWNSRGQDECEICRTTLYFSMVTNTAGKRICLCLQHALQLMDAPKQDSTTVYEVVTVISDAELQTTLANVQKRLSL
ncbi:hypothetical protein O3G_MSEX004010 [Manduca sexta]|uniref:Protein Jumonji n=1 Tax=Manduca sexta TaxID=7130 RepID=A0A921YU03_MANSE|nr:hypothetical protein O3G_MSEX004010 [Manduca sexta]